MDVLETPGTRLTSVRFTLTTASRSVAWTVSRRCRIPGRVRLRADYTSRDQIFERLGVEREREAAVWHPRRYDFVFPTKRSDRGNEFLRGRGRSQTFVYYVGRYRVSNAHDVAAMLTWPGVAAARKCQTSRPIRYSHAWKSRAKSIHSSTDSRSVGVRGAQGSKGRETCFFDPVRNRSMSPRPRFGG